MKPFVKRLELSPYSMPEGQIPMGSVMYKKIEPKRPTVIRDGDKVRTCYYFNGMKQCLGVRCFWPRVGSCAIMEKVNKKNGKKMTFKKKTYTTKKKRTA